MRECTGTAVRVRVHPSLSAVPCVVNALEPTSLPIPVCAPAPSPRLDLGHLASAFVAVAAPKVSGIPHKVVIAATPVAATSASVVVIHPRAITPSSAITAVTTTATVTAATVTAAEICASDKSVSRASREWPAGGCALQVNASSEPIPARSALLLALPPALKINYFKDQHTTLTSAAVAAPWRTAAAVAATTTSISTAAAVSPSAIPAAAAAVSPTAAVPPARLGRAAPEALRLGTKYQRVAAARAVPVRL